VPARELSTLRKVAFGGLLITAIPFLVFGLIDPLEGGISLIIAWGIYLAAFIVGRSKPPRYLWLPLLVATLIGLIVLVLATFRYQLVGEEQAFPIALVVGNWLYRAAVLTSLVGGVITVIRSLKSPTSTT
jgi:hypothetical protein